VKRLVLPLCALVALFVGVINASSRATATTTVIVNVFGNGKVTSSPSGISCGGGSKKCVVAFTEGASVKLTAKASGGWNDVAWGLDGADTNCTGTPVLPTINVPVAGASPQTPSTSNTVAVSAGERPRRGQTESAISAPTME